MDLNAIGPQEYRRQNVLQPKEQETELLQFNHAEVATTTTRYIYIYESEEDAVSIDQG